MTDNAIINLAMVRNVAKRLGDLAENVVFLGGAATALLIIDSAANDVRPTIDVDVIVEVTTMAEYHRLAEQLRERGFREDTREDAPLCRWLIGRMIVDIMPIDGLLIRVVTGPYFLATKLDAFHGRGNGDFMASHDMEDIIALVDGRSELVNEIAQGPENLRIHLIETFRKLLRNDRFLEALPGHLAGDPASQQRLPILETRLNRIAEMV